MKRENVNCKGGIGLYTEGGISRLKAAGCIILQIELGHGDKYIVEYLKPVSTEDKDKMEE